MILFSLFGVIFCLALLIYNASRKDANLITILIWVGLLMWNSYNLLNNLQLLK